MRGHYRASDDGKARLTIILPVEVEQQLRRLAAQKGGGINAIVRGWIVEKLSALSESCTDRGRRTVP